MTITVVEEVTLFGYFSYCAAVAAMDLADSAAATAATVITDVTSSGLFFYCAAVAAMDSAAATAASANTKIPKGAMAIIAPLAMCLFTIIYFSFLKICTPFKKNRNWAVTASYETSAFH